jgi:hypothetical protein
MSNTMYFPFTPGIQWKVNNGFLQPKVKISVLDRMLYEKDITVICYGGFIEALCSLTILETINRLFPSASLYWEGSLDYKPLIDQNGLAKITKDFLGEDELTKYPLPLFFNLEENAYFNCLNNYLILHDIAQTKKFKKRKNIIRQITDNNLVEWNSRYLPQFRLLKEYSHDIEKKLVVGGVNPNKFFVLLVPDKSSFSIHDRDWLKWDIRRIKSFNAMLKSIGVPLVIATNEVGKYYEFPCVVPLDVSNMIYLLKTSSVVLSRDIDYLMGGFMMGSAAISTWNRKRPQYDLRSAEKSFGYMTKVLVKKKMQPADAFEFIKKYRE